MLELKDSVRIAGLRPEMVLAATIVSSIFDDMEKDCIITSAVDSKHGYGSLHFAGCALDFRIRHLEDGEAERIVMFMKDVLGQDFDVVLEETHIHLEFQPKTGINL